MADQLSSTLNRSTMNELQLLQYELGDRVVHGLYLESTESEFLSEYVIKYRCERNATPKPMETSLRLNDNDNFKEKKLNGRIQFLTSNPDPEAFKKRVQDILELNLPKDSFYIKWSE